MVEPLAPLPHPVRTSAEYAEHDEDDGGDDDAAGLLANDDKPRRGRSDSVVFDFSTRLIHLSESEEHKGPLGVRDESITVLSGLALIVGMQIGSGIFSSPGVVAKEAGSVGAALLLWTGAGFLSWAGASSFAELGTALPMSGGQQVYLSAAFGPLPAYCFSFTAVTALKPGSQDLCRLMYHTAFSLDPKEAARGVPTLAIKLTGIIAICLVSAMQAWSSKAGTRAQLVLTVFKVGALVLVFVGGLVFLGLGKAASDFSFGGSSTQPAGYALALFSALWTFDGWDQCNYVSKDCAPGALPVIINSSLATVLCLFVLANIAYFLVLPFNVATASSTIALDFGRALAGPVGGVIFALIVSVSCLGALNGSLYTSSRLIVAAGEQGFLPKLFASYNLRQSTPINGILLSTSLTVLFILFGDFAHLTLFYGALSDLPRHPRPLRLNSSLSPHSRLLLKTLRVARCVRLLRRWSSTLLFPKSAIKYGPSHYVLTIKTDLVNKTFSGTGEISISILSPLPAGSPLVLNVADPLVLHAAVLAEGNVVRRASSLNFLPGKERVEIRFDGGGIGVGEVKLGLRWTGDLNRSMKMSLANMDMESVENIGPNGDFLITTLFPKMSSYLVAFANGKFEQRHDAVNGVDLAFYAPYDIEQTEYAMQVTKRVLPIYERIFDIKYPLRKLDTLVVSDFDLGAMENFGLVTGRTSVYLCDERRAGLAAKKGVASTTSHEISHQWFGNIVTMEYWDSLWLNESFATIMGEVIMIDQIEPTWNTRASFISDHLKGALALDALPSSHPIRVSCPNEDAILSVFDAISYSKGASVLRMLSSMVGEDAFLRGVSIYLKANLYGNATTEQLWEGISEASQMDVGTMMLSWTTKVGYPVLSVVETSSGLEIRQARFLSTGKPSAEQDTVLWHVPLGLVSVKDGKARVTRQVMTTRETILPLKGVANLSYKLNSETTGFYRVSYSPERLSKLGDEAGKSGSAFSTSDRMGLVQDAIVLAASGYSLTSGALTLISKLGGETENLVWGCISDALAKLKSAWWEQAGSDRDALKALGRQLFSPVARRLGFEYLSSDDPDTTELRTLSVATAADCGDEDVLEEYRIRFRRFLNKGDESEIPSDLRRSIYSDGVARGGREAYEKVLSVYRKPATPSHKSAAIAGLCATADSDLLSRTFDLVLSDEVKTQDISSFFANLSNNTASRSKLWNWFQLHFDELMVRFKGNFQLSRIISSSFGGFSSQSDLDAVSAFFATKDSTPYAPSLLQTLDAVKAKIAWLDRDVEGSFPLQLLLLILETNSA
ncbi:hypothetical protein RQP46_004527 [Phenoliferia psychrophenolica]